MNPADIKWNKANKRIMVIGPCGAGKSTFSKRLASLTKLDIYHLDQFYWKPNWVETNKEEWHDIVEGLAAKPEWIIDGNYGGTMATRLEKAEAIFYLDFSTAKCLWRITKRIMKYHGQVRPDMPEGCKERFDLEFYHYVATYNLLRRKSLMRKLNGLGKGKQVFIFKNDKQTSRFLDGLKNS